MSDARLPRAVLDTNVIYSRVLHELIGRLAYDERLLNLIWSDELLSEAQRILTERKPMPLAAAQRWVGYMPKAFPEHRIDIDHLATEVDLTALTSDPNDHHVCALAIAGRADLLLTFDNGYFDESLAQHGVEVLEPDAFLDRLLEEESQALRRIVQAQTRVWAGGQPIDELMNALERAGAPSFAAKARNSFGV